MFVDQRKEGSVSSARRYTGAKVGPSGRSTAAPSRRRANGAVPGLGMGTGQAAAGAHRARPRQPPKWVGQTRTGTQLWLSGRYDSGGYVLSTVTPPDSSGSRSAGARTPVRLARRPAATLGHKPAPTRTPARRRFP